MKYFFFDNLSRYSRQCPPEKGCAGGSLCVLQWDEGHGSPGNQLARASLHVDTGTQDEGVSYKMMRNFLHSKQCWSFTNEINYVQVKCLAISHSDECNKSITSM